MVLPKLGLGPFVMLLNGHQVFQKTFYCTSRVLYKCLECVSLKLPNFVCEEIVKNAACLRKGKGYHYLNQDLFGTRC